MSCGFEETAAAGGGVEAGELSAAAAVIEARRIAATPTAADVSRPRRTMPYSPYLARKLTECRGFPGGAHRAVETRPLHELRVQVVVHARQYEAVHSGPRSRRLAEKGM